MKITNSWVGYLDRSYEQIKRNVIKRLPVEAPEITDHNDTNPLIVILSFFAGIVEHLNYYIDNMAREAFISTARLYSSVVKHAKTLNYSIKSAQFATADVTFTLVDSLQQPVVATKNILIPKGTIVSNDTIRFVTTVEATLLSGATTVSIPCANYVEVSDSNLGNTSGQLSQRLPLPSSYANGTLRIKIDGEYWKTYEHLGQIRNNEKGVIVEVDEDGVSYLVFGDNINGVVPPTGKIIYASYKITDGALGNLPPFTINTLESAVSTGIENTSLSVTNPDYSAGGRNTEDIETIRNLAPRSLRTVDRATSYQDFIDQALMVPGVGSAEVKYCCGKYVELYITPFTVGIASAALKQIVLERFLLKKMVTTNVDVLSAGLSVIWLKAKVYGKPLYTESEIRRDVVNALYNLYGFPNSKINGSVITSDVTFVLESLTKVDKAEIEEIRIKPYVRTTFGDKPLTIVFNALPTSAVNYNYRIIWDAVTNKFLVYRTGVFVDSISSGNTLNDGIVNITLTNNMAYDDGARWEFKVSKSYPAIFPQGTIEVKDFSIPYFEIGDPLDETTPRTIYSDITIITQNIPAAGLPSCN